MATTDPGVKRRRTGRSAHWSAPDLRSSRSRDAGPPAPPPPDAGGEIFLMSGINLLAAAWLVVAPWVLGYWTSDPRWNDMVCGAVVGTFAFARATAPFQAAWLSWLNALIGAWLLVAAFAIDRSPSANWNDGIVGGVVFVLAIGSATAASSRIRRRRSRS